MTRAADAVANALAETGRSAPERFYRRVLEIFQQRDVPHLVGGAYALAHHTHVPYETRDFDVFLRRADVGRACQSLEDAGYRAAVVYPHFLGKVRDGVHFVDLIFGSGNGIVPVDDRWFTRASSGMTLGLPVRFCSAEDILWSKAFIMERERYDGGDVAHLLLATADRLDWAYLIERFDAQWRVLLAHFVLFGFIYRADGRSFPPMWWARCSNACAASPSRPIATTSAEEACCRDGSTCSISTSSACGMHDCSRTAQ